MSVVSNTFRTYPSTTAAVPRRIAAASRRAVRDSSPPECPAEQHHNNEKFSHRAPCLATTFRRTQSSQLLSRLLAVAIRTASSESCKPFTKWRWHHRRFSAIPWRPSCYEAAADPARELGAPPGPYRRRHSRLRCCTANGRSECRASSVASDGGGMPRRIILRGAGIT